MIPRLLDTNELTVVSAKRTRYRREPAFLDGLDDVIRRTGADGPRILQAHCLTIVKPEGIAGARLDGVAHFARSMGFRLLDTAPCRLTPAAAAITWRYQMNAATPDRAALAYAMMDATDSLALLWRQGSDHQLPASVRMASRKGPADPAQRDPRDLRSALGSPNRVITFVHIPDEPIDLVRDMTYLLPAHARSRFLESMSTPHDGTEPALPKGPGRRSPHPALMGPSAGVEAQERIIEAATAALRRGRRQGAEELAKLRSELGDGETPIGWPRIEGVLRMNEVHADFWDLIRVASDRGVHDRPGVEKLIGDSGVRGWVDGSGVRHG
jgi:hypothetical protein